MSVGKLKREMSIRNATQPELKQVHALDGIKEMKDQEDQSTK